MYVNGKMLQDMTDHSVEYWADRPLAEFLKNHCTGSLLWEIIAIVALFIATVLAALVVYLITASLRFLLEELIDSVLCGAVQAAIIMATSVSTLLMGRGLIAVVFGGTFGTISCTIALLLFAVTVITFCTYS